MKLHPYVTISVPLVALLLLLFATTPQSVPSVVLVLPFALFFILLLSGAVLLLKNGGRSARASWTIAMFMATVPTVLLVLQSIGQLTPRDLITILALFVIAYFYAARAETPAK